MDEYSIFIKPEAVNEEGTLATLVEELGAMIIAGNRNYGFSIQYDGDIEELKEKLKEKGCDLETVTISPRIHVIVGDEHNPF